MPLGAILRDDARERREVGVPVRHVEQAGEVHALVGSQIVEKGQRRRQQLRAIRARLRVAIVEDHHGARERHVLIEVAHSHLSEWLHGERGELGAAGKRLVRDVARITNARVGVFFDRNIGFIAFGRVQAVLSDNAQVVKSTGRGNIVEGLDRTRSDTIDSVVVVNAIDGGRGKVRDERLLFLHHEHKRPGEEEQGHEAMPAPCGKAAWFLHTMPGSGVGGRSGVGGSAFGYKEREGELSSIGPSLANNLLC